MPGGDGTGPAGMGPMTGRAAGFCAGYGVPGYANPIGGRGFWGGGRGFFGWGRGGGRGFRNRFFATGLTGWQRGMAGWPVYGGVAPVAPVYGAPVATQMTQQQQLDALNGQAEYFQEALESIRKQIKELESKKD